MEKEVLQGEKNMTKKLTSFMNAHKSWTEIVTSVGFSTIKPGTTPSTSDPTNSALTDCQTGTSLKGTMHESELVASGLPTCMEDNSRLHIGEM